MEAEGRTLKIALGCRDGALGLTELIPGGLRWVIDVPTQVDGITRVTVPFSGLHPTVRAKPVGLPLRFDAGGILGSRCCIPSSENPESSIQDFVQDRSDC